MFRNLLQQWLKPKRRPITRPNRRRHLRPHLHLEMLEDRITPSTVTVTNESQLETAIQQANSNSDISAIVLQAGGTYDPHAELTITATQALTIQGNGSSASATVLDPNSGDDRVLHQNRVFHVESGANVTFQNLTIQGGTAINANGGGILDEGGKVALSNVVLQHNQATNADGGGIYQDGGSLTIGNSIIQNNQADGDGGGVNGTNISINASTLSGNTAANGGGLWAGGGGLLIANSTLSGNTASNNGGGAFIDSSSPNGSNTLVNSTFAVNTAVDGGGLYFNQNDSSLFNLTVADNTASEEGGGIDTNSGANPSVGLFNVLVAGNQAPTGADFRGGVGLDQGHNLIGVTAGVTGTGFNGPGDLLNVNAHLGQLANNGGPTQTIALLAGSPAIDAGDNGAQLYTGPNDQRGPGFPRVAGGTIDIGAFEVQPPTSSPPAPPPSPPPSATPPAPPSPPPSLVQALITIYIDAAEIPVNTVALGIGFSYGSPEVSAATELIDSLEALRSALVSAGFADNDDIQTNFAFAGAFGEYAYAAGYQAGEQLLPPSPG